MTVVVKMFMWLVFLLIFLASVHIPSVVKAMFAYHFFDDSTPKVKGRMVWWNPIPNLDILGTLSFIFLMVPWSKPMEIRWNDLKNKRFANSVIELTDCATTLFLGFVGCLFHLLFSRIQLASNLDLRTLMFFLDLLVSLNVFLFFLKLLPIPQLPGFRILVGLFYHKPQGVFDSLMLTLMGTAIIVILMIWSPLSGWLVNVTRLVIAPFSASGASFLPHVGQFLSIGGLF
jgi:Zn-dependent protease